MTGRSSRLGLSLPTVVGLALLAVPRVVTHDLGLVGPHSLPNALLALVPPAVWLAVVLWRRPPNPFLTLLAVGAVYGVLLAVGHQLMWDATWGGEPPALGGTLRGALDPTVEAGLLRGAAFAGSLVTGTLVGALVGGAAWALERARRT